MHAGMRSVCVFLSSSAGSDPAYTEAVRALGAQLAQRGLRLVYGGSSLGLMRELADAALAAGGEVVGVIPQTLVGRELAHQGLTELHVVETMHQRKALMSELADGFVIAPGGFGTFEEAFEVLTGRQLNLHDKPVVFLDVRGFWQPLLTFLDHAVTAGVLRPAVRELLLIAGEVPAVLELLLAPPAPVTIDLAAGQSVRPTGPAALATGSGVGPTVVPRAD